MVTVTGQIITISPPFADARFALERNGIAAVACLPLLFLDAALHVASVRARCETDVPRADGAMAVLRFEQIAACGIRLRLRWRSLRNCQTKLEQGA